MNNKKSYPTFFCRSLLVFSLFIFYLTDVKSYAASDNLNFILEIDNPLVTITDSKVHVKFEYNVESTNEYNVFAWVSPYSENGELVKYDMFVNDQPVSNFARFEKLGWQYIKLNGSDKILFREGNNSVELIGNLPEIPSVEHIIITDKDIIEEPSCLNNFTCKSIIENYDYKSSETNLIIPTLQNNAPYSYTYSQNLAAEYTFTKSLYLKKGEVVNISSKTTNNIMHGIAIFSDIKDSFNEIYCNHSNFSSNPSLSAVIPESGVYKIRIRSYLNGVSDMCYVNINNMLYSEKISCTEITCHIPSNTLSNSFTRNNTSQINLYLERKDGLMKARILGYNFGVTNNDYDSSYEWTGCSRIRDSFPYDVTSAYVFSSKSSKPISECDLYLGMQEDKLNMNLYDSPVSEGDCLISHRVNLCLSRQ